MIFTLFFFISHQNVILIFSSPRLTEKQLSNTASQICNAILSPLTVLCPDSQMFTGRRARQVFSAKEFSLGGGGGQLSILLDTDTFLVGALL